MSDIESIIFLCGKGRLYGNMVGFNVCSFCWNICRFFITLVISVGLSRVLMWVSYCWKMGFGFNGFPLGNIVTCSLHAFGIFFACLWHHGMSLGLWHTFGTVACLLHCGMPLTLWHVFGIYAWHWQSTCLRYCGTTLACLLHCGL